MNVPTRGPLYTCLVVVAEFLLLLTHSNLIVSVVVVLVDVAQVSINRGVHLQFIILYYIQQRA